MAEDVNFPLDQSRNTSAFQGLREASRDASFLERRLADEQREELNDPEEAQAETERQPVNEVASLESRIEISQGARQRIEEESQNPTERENQQEQQEDIAEAERRELQANRQEVSNDARSEFRNPRSQGPAGGNELARVSEGFVQDTDERLEEGFRLGNDISNPDRIDEFRNGAQIDSVQEAVQRGGEDALEAQGQDDLTSRLREEPSIRDLARNASAVQDQESFRETIDPELPSPEESAREELQGNRVSVQNPRVQELVNEANEAEEAERLRNEPAIETPDQTIEPIETQEEPIQEGLDINPLRGPRPSELRDESDASAVETERGQNISDLI